MKLSTALVTGIFISASALFYFRQEEKLMRLIWGQENPVAVAEREKEKKKEKNKEIGPAAVQQKIGAQTRKTELSWKELFVPAAITAVKTVDKPSNAVAGDFLNYTVTITNNTGSTASNLAFTDDVDPNTTVVAGSLQTSPVAFDDSYTAIGNVGINVPDANGILTNDALGTNPAASYLGVVNAATAQGGIITINGAGGFSYTPAPGFTGNDNYTYTLTNPAGSSTATITIAVSGMIWFINNASAASTEDGRINTPYKSITNFQTNNTGATGKPGENHFVFVYENLTPYAGNITLRNGQKLIGQDATTDLPTITSYNAGTYPYSISLLPALNNGNATIVSLTASGADNVVTLNNAAGSNTIRGVTIGNKVSGSGINGSNFGTLTLSETAVTGTGQALNLSTGTVNATFENLSSSSGTNAVFLTGINGTVALGGGALSGSSGDVFIVNGGTAGITYSGTISKTTAGNVLDIQNKTGGTVAFSGAISATAPGEGINLQSNGGTTVNFTGGLNLSTAGGVAFNATGGGIISATQNNSTIVNTLVTTTATALNVAGTTIGSGGLTFRSINVGTVAGGPTASGISLNNTGSGGLTVTGQGTTAGSGGTIQQVTNRGIELIAAQNIDLNNMQLTNANTGDAGFSGVCDELNNGSCFAAVYGSSVTTLKLTQVNITTTAEQGINLNNVTALAINNCTVQGNGNANEEGALKAQDLKGTCTITNSTFKNSANRIAHIRNNSGTVNLSVSNSNFINEAGNTSPVKQDCFQMRLKNTTSATISITNSAFKRAGTAAIQIMAEDNSTATVTITGCTADREGTLMKGIEIGSDHTAKMYASVNGNPLVTANGEVSLNVVSTGTTSLMNATASNNTIKGGNDQENNFTTVNLWATQTATNNVLVGGNTISEIDGRAGIESVALHSQPIGGTSTINATIQNNSVTGNAGFITGNGLRASSSATGGVGASANCSQIAGNTITVAPSRPSLNAVATNTSSIRLSGSGTNVTEIWNNNGNAPASPPAIVQATAIAPATITFGGGACPTPTGTPIAAVALSSSQALLFDGQPDAGNTVLPEVNSPEIVAAADLQPAPTVSSLEMATEAPVAAAVTETVSNTNVTVANINLPAAKSIIIKFQVQVNSPLPTLVCAISNQGTVSGPSITSILTDNDADAGNGINPTVTTVKDEIAPQITCPANITVNNTPDLCNAVVNFTGANAATATDNCSTPAITYSPVSGTTFAKGTTTVTATATDAAGNTAQCTFTVTVVDNQQPTITCPVNISVNAPAGEGSVTVDPGTPTGNDNCGTVNFSGARSDNQDLDAPYPVGTTTITWTATDASNLTATCQQTVTVNDITPPSVTINQASGQADPTGSGPINFTVVFTEPVTGFATGDVSFAGSTVPGTLVGTVTGSGSTYNVAVTGMTGSGTVIASIAAGVATDISNNGNTASTSTDNSITYVACQVIAPANITVDNGPGQCGAVVSYNIPEPTGSCGTVTGSPASGSFFKVGVTTVMLSSTTGQTATFEVTVLDKAAPVISNCPSDITIYTGTGNTTCTQTATWTEPTATDNCAGVVGVQKSHAPGATFSKGTTTVTYTFTDVAGKESTCTFTVTVVDNTLPVVSNCPANISLPALAGTCARPVSWTEPTASDACGPITLISRSHVPGASFNVGNTTVTYRFKDASNNEISCSFKVTITDGQPPVIGTVTASPNALKQNNHKMTTVKINYPVVTDNCGVAITPVLSVSSDEPMMTSDKGDKAPDWVVIDANTVQLRSERWSKGDGREYTITVMASDGVNQAVPKTVTVKVPFSSSLSAIEHSDKEFLFETPLEVKVLPNPSSSYFTVNTLSSAAKALTFRVTDAVGRLVEVRSGIAPSGSVTLGHRYAAGVYFLEVIQGKERQVLKLIKHQQ